MPRTNFTGGVWYKDTPVGVNTLQKVVKSVCAQAGLNGHFTNQSLKSTSATRMFQRDTEEQVIQEFTGHRSLAVC